MSEPYNETRGFHRSVVVVLSALLLMSAVGIHACADYSAKKLRSMEACINTPGKTPLECQAAYYGMVSR